MRCLLTFVCLLQQRFCDNFIERPGQDIVVKVDVTANHKVEIHCFSVFTVKSLNFKVASGYQVIVVVQGYFTFKMCANNDTDQDPRQECFDR